MARALACLAATILLAAPTHAREVAGVNVPDTMSVEGAELTLNGAGLRRATMFNVKVYVGALYVAQPSGDAEAIVRADEPKSVLMHFLRDVAKDKVMEAFREGFEKNSASEAAALVPQLERVAAVVPAEMKPGMQLTVTYLPGKGTLVTAPEGRVTIPGKPFADAMFRNWLGPKPADGGLKDEMLKR